MALFSMSRESEENKLPALALDLGGTKILME